MKWFVMQVQKKDRRTTIIKEIVNSFNEYEPEGFGDITYRVKGVSSRLFHIVKKFDAVLGEWTLTVKVARAKMPEIYQGQIEKMISKMQDDEDFMQLIVLSAVQMGPIQNYKLCPDF